MTMPNRPSTSLAFRLVESVGGTLVNLVVGAALFIPGLMGFMTELRIPYQCDEALHVGHISIFVGLMVGGALVVKPTFGASLSSIVVSVFPNGIPLLGGRRSSDPKE